MLRLVKAILLLGLIVIMGCKSYGPGEIHYGQDQCDYCNMNIVDNAFGSQLVTTKGKVFKFDSIECLAAHVQTSKDGQTGVNQMWLTDFKNPGSFVRADSATVIFSDKQNSPMGIGLVGFSSSDEAQEFIVSIGGRIMSWAETRDLVKERWRL